MASVEIVDVKKLFGDIEVMHGVSAHIADGEFVALVGPSGCGKSTLLRMIAGLETISSGTISIGERVVNGLAPKDRDIAMVFQNYALYPQMTVKQNMGFSLEMAGVNKPEIEQQVAKAAAILGLEPLLGRYPRQLSGGQRQRVAMGRSIVRDPKVFLFDEPLSNLDAKLRVQMRSEIKSLQSRLKTTMIYVTHDQIEAMTMADKVVVMHAGRVEQIGTPLDLYDQPVNQFVAGFIGSPSMNFIHGQLNVNMPAALDIGDGISLPLKIAPTEYRGREVVYGIRPEHIVVDPIAGAPFRVTVVEPTGSETYITVQGAGQTIACLFRQRMDVHVGETLKLSFAQDAAHFFDPVSKLRINVA